MIDQQTRVQLDKMHKQGRHAEADALVDLMEGRTLASERTFDDVAIRWWETPLKQPPEPEIFGVLPLEHYSSLYGPWGGAKSWLLAAFAIEAARLGNRVVYIDREADARRFHLRIHKLGGMDHRDSIGYVRAHDPETLDIIASWSPALVLIDSVAASGGGQSWDAFLEWHGSIVRPLLDADIAVCSIDHDNKQTADRETGKRISRGASGGHEKSDAIQGVGMWLTGQALTREQDGDLQLLIDKDNSGRTTRNDWRVLMARTGEGIDERIAVTVRPTDAADVLRDVARIDSDDRKKATWLQKNGPATINEMASAFNISGDAARPIMERIGHTSKGHRGNKPAEWMVNPGTVVLDA